MDELFAIYLRDRDVKPSSLRDCQGVIRRELSPWFGWMRATDLTAAAVKDAIAPLVESGKLRTAQKAIVYLKAVLRHAARKKIMPPHPIVDERLMTYRAARMRYLNEAELTKFLAEARQDRLFALYGIAALPGVREGELVALQWGDVDSERGLLTIRETFDQRSRKQWSAKTEASSRTIELPAQLVEWIILHREACASNGLPVTGVAHVFTTAVGTPLYFSNVLRRSFYPLLARAGLPRIRFHDLRHTAATIMLRRGVAPHVVSKILGHADVETTLRIYGHVIPGMVRDAVDRMSDLLPVAS